MNWTSNVIFRGPLFVFIQFRCEVISRFVDIGIVDHPSLFKLSHFFLYNYKLSCYNLGNSLDRIQGSW